MPDFDKRFLENTKPVDVRAEVGKPRLLAILFCDYLNITADGKTNLMGIFDRIYVHSRGRLTPKFSLFLRSVDTIEEPLRVRVFSPDGSPTMGMDFADFDDVVFTPNLPAHIQSTLKVRFPVEDEGVYWFNVFYKGESLGGAALATQYRATEDRKGGTDTYI